MFQRFHYIYWYIVFPLSKVPLSVLILSHVASMYTVNQNSVM